MMPWQPVVDGRVVPGEPIDRIAAGSAGPIDVIVGTNVDDWRLWLLVSGAFPRITDEILTGPITSYGYQSLAAYGLPVERGARGLPSQVPAVPPRRRARGGADRLVDADPGHSPR